MKYLRKIYQDWSFAIFILLLILVSVLIGFVNHCQCSWYWYLSMVRLTRRETEILGLIAAGRTTKQIADQLFRSPKTIEKVRATIREKLGLKTTAELANYYACSICKTPR